MSKEDIRKLDTCSLVRELAGERDYRAAWQECERGDWLIEVCEKMLGGRGWPKREEVVIAACACAAKSLKYSNDKERRPHKAIITGRRWARGHASVEDVRAAAISAYWAAYSVVKSVARYPAELEAYPDEFVAYSAALAASAAAGSVIYESASVAVYEAAVAETFTDKWQALRESAHIVRRMLVPPFMREVE